MSGPSRMTVAALAASSIVARAGRRALIGGSGSAEQPDRRRLFRKLLGRGHGAAPRDGLEALAGAHERTGETLGRLDGFEIESPAVAQPAPVHRVLTGVDALIAHQLVAAGVDRDPATDRARH